MRSPCRPEPSASTLFPQLLSDAIGHFDDVFEGLLPPSSSHAFKEQLGSFLIAFEQRRRASSRAAEVARTS